jgi:hypothetical protein
MRKFISSLQVPTYNNFQHYYFQDILSMLSKKYISHHYVIEYLQKLEDLALMSEEKTYREEMFEEEMDNIHVMGAETKI